MNKDVEEFLSDITWCFKEREKIEIIGEKSFQCSAEFEGTFPQLTKLLSKARITVIQYGNVNYELFGWKHNVSSQSLGWLCLEPLKGQNINKSLHPNHSVLLQNFGGITERWNEPLDTWLVNLNNALTYENIKVGFGSMEDIFQELCEEEGVEIKVNTSDFISFAFEANGNITMYHKISGKVLMYAHDHNFEHLISFSNYPEYTLYEIESCETLNDWIENIASQWLRHIKM
ncbi:hypothetical protein [Bacillus sp. SM2101]|uniref:hypothetical protein n=1 Tax=Bacillus sp. SM2101 TaxID=2805366 RepID=UPI001BDEBF53|nr:hypothetical protein [Bacillus sp. SM2101]